MAEQLKAIPLSTLPEITDDKKGNYWVFASTEDKDGVFESGRYNLAKYINEANNYLQLERRISLTMERATHTMFIGEEMTIYKIETHNISKLIINNDEIDLSRFNPITITPKSLVTFDINRITETEPIGYLFIYAKAKSL